MRRLKKRVTRLFELPFFFFFFKIGLKLRQNTKPQPRIKLIELESRADIFYSRLFSWEWSFDHIFNNTNGANAFHYHPSVLLLASKEIKLGGEKGVYRIERRVESRPRVRRNFGAEARKVEGEGMTFDKSGARREHRESFLVVAKVREGNFPTIARVLSRAIRTSLYYS